MRLPVPNLDDRRWSDLAEEGRNLIPRYAPEWTDFNVHDPGITLVELLAWIAEMDLYRLNRIPAAHRLKFLELLGIVPYPPRPAQSLVQFSLSSGSVPLYLPAGTEVETQATEGSIRFRTLTEVTVLPVQLIEIWQEDAEGLHDLTTMWQNGEALPLFGNVPDVGAAIYLGFNEALPQDHAASLYFRFASTKSGAEERKRLEDEIKEAQQVCVPPPSPCGGYAAQLGSEEMASVQPPATILEHHSARTEWEFSWGDGNGNSWQRLDPEQNEVSDDTRSFTLDGFVRAQVSATMVSLSLMPNRLPLYWLRCRFVSGAYDAAPLLGSIHLNSAAVEQAVPVASVFVIAANAVVTFPDDSPPPTLNKFTLRFNAAGEISSLSFLSPEAEAPEFVVTDLELPTGTTNGRLAVEVKLSDRGLGEPGQQVVLQPAPVQAESVEIYTLQDDTWHAWSTQPDFDASARADRHFTLDATTGTVTFGDGEHGLPVPKGALVFTKFRQTQAEAGNVAAGKIVRLSNSAHNQAIMDVHALQSELQLTNPYEATGGAAAETLLHAEGRVLQEVDRTTRAVTIADVEELALSTPGTDIARVAAKPNVDMRYPCLQAPGVTSVIALPRMPAPGVQPSAGLRAAVREFLNQRRILGNRIEVVGPCYTGVKVKARVQSQANSDKTRVQQEVVSALHDFFDPFHGGPDRNGWPFGRDVFRSEVMHTIDSVAGVENVLFLELIADDGEPSCGNLCLGPCGLVISEQHEIVVE